MTENLPRVLPGGTSAIVERNSWRVPPIFSLIQSMGQVDDEEMFSVFNMGVGMVLIVAGDHHQQCIDSAKARGLEAWCLGEVRKSADRGVRYV